MTWVVKWWAGPARDLKKPYLLSWEGPGHFAKWTRYQRKAKRFKTREEAEDVADAWVRDVRPRVVRIVATRIERAFDAWHAVPHDERQAFLDLLVLRKSDVQAGPGPAQRRRATYDAAIALLSARRS